MENQFAKTIDQIQAVAGFDAVAQAMQFAKTPAFIKIGTPAWKDWHAAKRQFFSKLFRDNPVAACLCYALSESISETIDTNDFDSVYENNKDERFIRCFITFIDDYSILRDCGYFGGQSQHDQLFDLIGKDLHKMQRGETIAFAPLSDYIDTLEHRRLESLRCDAQYFARLSMQENHTFYPVKVIAESLGIFDVMSKEHELIQYYASQIYAKYRFEIVNGLTTNLESI